MDHAAATPVPGNHTTEGGVLLGDPAAPRLVVFEDPQCPYCRQFEESSGEFLQGEVTKGALAVEYRMRCFLGVESVRADNALALAAEAGRFDELRRALFAAQPPEQTGGFTISDLSELGRRVGLTDEAYSSGLVAGRYEPWVIETERRFQEQDPQGTPAALLGTEPLDRARPVRSRSTRNVAAPVRTEFNRIRGIPPRTIPGGQPEHPRSMTYGYVRGMYNDMRVLDGDGHVLEPWSAWTSLPEQYRPTAVTDGDGLDHVLIGGQEVFVARLGQMGQPGTDVGAPSGPVPLGEARTGAFDPAARLVDMDSEAIDEVVLYPTIGLGFWGITGPESRDGSGPRLQRLARELLRRRSRPSLRRGDGALPRP